jgi:NtrC-family two-component system response regulator AlgB
MSRRTTTRPNGEKPPPDGGDAKPRARVLIVDDEESIARVLRICLERAGYQPIVASSGEAGVAAARRFAPDIAFVDLRLGGMNGLEVTRMLRRELPRIAVVIMTAYATIDNAVEAIRTGAVDYLAKPFSPEQVRSVAERALASLRPESDADRGPYKSPMTFESKSPTMTATLALAERVAATDATVLLLGETGSGKGVLARRVHTVSTRRAHPFVTVNCAVISPSVIENELFGHARGAFTGADAARPGFIEAAGDGTLFLDEIGDLPLACQGKLLRLLEEHEFSRMGETEVRRSTARVVAATHADLRAAVQDGTFREDLYYRLNVVSLRLPALRERREDIGALADAVLADLATRHERQLALTSEARAMLTAYAWPGNLRELVNVLERAVILARTDAIGLGELPDELRGAAVRAAEATPAMPPDETLETAERQHLAAVLARHPTLNDAARALGIDPSTLFRKRERHRLR